MPDPWEEFAGDTATATAEDQRPWEAFQTDVDKGLGVASEVIGDVLGALTSPAVGEASQMGRREIAKEPLKFEKGALEKEGELARAGIAAADAGEFALRSVAGMEPSSLARRIFFPNARPIVPPEAAIRAVEFIDPFGVAPEGSARQGAQQFVGETASGLTSPDAALALAAGKYIPASRPYVGRYFQMPMIQQSGEAAGRLSEARTPGELTKAGLETALTVAAPLGIESGLIDRTDAAPPGRLVTPITGEVIRMPEGYGPRPRVMPPRPEVPGTPAESRAVPTPEQEALIADQQMIKTVRAANAQTKAEIQQLFPEMNRQQAAQLRDRVWGRGEEPPPNAPAAPPGGPPEPPIQPATIEPAPKPPARPAGSPAPARATPETPEPTLKPAPPETPLKPGELPKMNPGEHLVTIERPDGTRYLAAYDPEKVYDFRSVGRGLIAQVSRLSNPDNPSEGWSHGMAKPGEKVIEDGGKSATGEIKAPASETKPTIPATPTPVSETVTTSPAPVTPAAAPAETTAASAPKFKLTFKQFLQAPREGELLDALRKLPKREKSAEELSAVKASDDAYAALEKAKLTWMVDHPEQGRNLSKAKQKIWDNYNKAWQERQRVEKAHSEEAQRHLYDEMVKAGRIEDPALAAQQQPELPGAAGASGGVQGFGLGSLFRRRGQQPAPPATTQQQVAQIQQRYTPGLTKGIRSLLLPSSIGPAFLRAAELVASKLGIMHRHAEASAYQLRGASRHFDRLGVFREDLSPAANPGVRFMSDMIQGRPMSPELQAIADQVDREFESRLDLLEQAGAPLQTIRDHYFPGIWTTESRLAFNAAMDEAIRRGIIPKDFDVNAATAQQRAAIKALTDEYLSKGVGSDKDFLLYLSRRPLAGRESFRKQKVFEDIMDAAEFGLRPVSYNPIDLVKVKLAEMDRSIMMHQYVQELKARGELKVISPYEEVPAGWVKINDKYGTIYGKPTVTIPEYIDKEVYEGLLGFAKSLGIKHERSMRFPPGPGSQALGLSYQGQNLVRTRFATETSVLAHEIGHQLDYRHGFWNEFVTKAVGLGAKGTPTKLASQRQREIIRKELRAVADLTGGRGGHSRQKAEQIAQMVEAYVHAPERMEQAAPTVYRVFDDFIHAHSDLKDLADIKPGIELKQLTSEKYVGLPIMGYRIVPEAHGHIINNYLSSSLYNNQYVGTLYKGWMSTANALNQTQLGMGSAFHGGFTTIEALVSSGANVLKDFYGVLRGNRTPADFIQSTGKSLASVIRNPMVGDAILNAWRHPEGTMSPRIRWVVEAAEAAGGGFKMEHGLVTEQSTKALRDWYSGHRLRAGARSPIALTELMAKPIMEYLVPRQKAGVFADMAWRIQERNPGKTPQELLPELRQAWNRVDARLGQVRYDRLFVNNMAKNLVQGLVRAPGWSGGTIAEIGGGFADAGRFITEFATTGKLPEDLPDRTAYVLSLLTGVTTANGILTYAFTGQQPTGMDYFAFRTGQKDERGNDERFLLPSYVKDMLAYAKHPGDTLLNKSHPLVTMFSDIARNKDYYGTEIRARGEGIPAQAGQLAGYVVKGFEPFWIRGTRREVERKAGPGRTLAPLIGVMPAPRSVTETPAESLAHDLMKEQIPAGARTRAEAERARQRAAERPKGEPILEHLVTRLKATSAVLVLEKANSRERARLTNMVLDKIDRARSLSPDEKAALEDRVTKANQ